MCYINFIILHIYINFKEKNEHENKLYELQTEIKTINLDNTEVENKMEEKNNSCKL